MRTLFAFACFALPAIAQYELPPGAEAPGLMLERHKDGAVTVTAAPRNAFPGVLLLGSFDGATASPLDGLPPVLVNPTVIAWAFAPGETISVTAPWPAVHVVLQAVEVGFRPFTLAASPLLVIGDRPITDQMLQDAARARSAAGLEN